MIPRIDLLIADSRIASLQKDYGDNYGIDQEFFIVALRNAQIELQSYVAKENGEFYTDYYDIDIVASQPNYDLPTDRYVGNLVFEVSYSSDGTELNFGDPLPWLHVRPPLCYGIPDAVFLDAGQIWIDPTPQSAGGKLRIRYEKTLPRLDFRRARVQSVNFSSSPYYLQLSTSSDTLWPFSDPDADALGGPPDYVSLVNNKGTTIQAAIPISSYDSSLFRLYIDTTWTLPSPAPVCEGSYVCVGYNASTHTPVEDLAEAYFIEYCKHQVTLLLSSTDTAMNSKKLEDMKAEIAELYSLRGTRPMGIHQSRGED